MSRPTANPRRSQGIAVFLPLVTIAVVLVASGTRDHAQARTIAAESPEALLRREVAASLQGEAMDDSLVVDAFGRVGLDPLTDDLRAGLRGQFDRFAPLLARAQGPIHSPSWDIQLLCLEAGSVAQQAAMTAELRRWFTDEIHEAPILGSLRIENAEGVREVLIGCRVTVAEMLAEYGDRTAIRGIREWSLGESMEPADRDRIIQSLARLEDPCHRRWLIPENPGRVAPCTDADTLVVRACRRTGDATACGDPIPPAAARALREVLHALPVRRASTLSVSPVSLHVSGTNGEDCRLVPASDGRSVFVYEQDMHEYGFAWRADSVELATWVIGWLKTVPK